MQPLRLFVAIELDDALRAALKRAQTHLQDEKNSGKIAKQCVRWVPSHNIHLTLKFLGNSSPSQVPALQNALTRIAEKTAPFELYARGLGCFPNARHPNNIWVGLEGDVVRAALLARQIDDACAAVGFARDAREFTPHLTLGRVKRDTRNPERAALGADVARLAPETYGEIRARSIALVASDLRPDGPMYSVLSEHFFTAPSLL